MNNDVKSTTYSLSSIDSLLNCNSLVLINSNELVNTRISIDNIVSVYRSIVIDKTVYTPHYKLDKKEEETGFYYELSKAVDFGLRNGFDEIIYVDTKKSTPLGYTELQTQIGVSSNLVIKINLTTGIDNNTENDLDLSFKLDSVTENLYSLKPMTGEGLSDYTATKDIINNTYPQYEPYTNKVSCLLQDNKRSIFLGDRVVVKSDDEFKIHKLGILSGREVDPFRNNFQTYKVGRYESDLAIYAWSKTKVNDKYQIDYCINSLTICNKFKNLLQYVHTKDNDGCCTIPDITEGGKTAVDINVLYVTGKYFICEGIFEDGTSVIKVLNTDAEDPFWINTPNDFVCISELETVPEIIKLTNKKINFSIESTKEILEKYPDLYSTYLDTRNLSSFFLKRKIGDWYLIQKNVNNGTTVYILAGKYSTLYLTSEDINRLIVVNNNTVMINNDNYYVMYSGIKKTWYTERYRAAFYDGSLIEYNGIEFANIGNNVKADISDDTYKNYYDKEIIKIIHKSSKISETILDKYRRNRYPENDTIPNIVDACDGIIFYIEDGKINYL